MSGPLNRTRGAAPARPRPSTRSGGRTSDRGRVSVFVAAAMPMMLVFLALTWDASDYLRALHRADNIAHEAARAAGQGIDLPLAVTGEQIVIDPAAAEAAAAAYLADAGVTGTVQVSDDRRSVTVTVAVPHRPRFLGAFGFGARTATGSAEAHLVNQ
ncbi:MAG TPA: pilus assembly protein TadG-related protein [Natronosporangium sp.]|nr:pilus assembly protein TadG-related protein [Natronosporangium sp.]